MAKRRMVTPDVVDTDKFLDLPVGSQNLYFHLIVRADDDGFVNSPKKITSMTNCKESDYETLIEKKYLIDFESGICVITHWKIHNTIQKDRYTETLYTTEKSQIKEVEKVYVSKMDT